MDVGINALRGAGKQQIDRDVASEIKRAVKGDERNVQGRKSKHVLCPFVPSVLASGEPSGFVRVHDGDKLADAAAVMLLCPRPFGGCTPAGVFYLGEIRTLFCDRRRDARFGLGFAATGWGGAGLLAA